MTRPPLNCREAFRRLDDYVDRELTPDEVADVEAHLAVCVACTDEFAVERDLLDAIRARLKSIRMPPDLMNRISERLSDV